MESKEEKRNFVIQLLKEHLSYSEIQEKLKVKFGSGMSNRDIGLLRKEIVSQNPKPTSETCQEAFIKFYETVLSLKDQITDQDILEELHEYHDLYYDTRKQITINQLPEDVRTPEVIKSISKSLDDIKNGNYTFLEFN